MTDHVLAIDAGTTTLRVIIAGPGGEVRAHATAPCRLTYPQPGLVEQDAGALWQSVQDLIREALASVSLQPAAIAAIGIASQRACAIVWDRATGRPLSPLVSWQDLRGIQRARELHEAGFTSLQPLSPACKLEAILANAAGKPSRLAWGNVDAYLAARLTGGKAHLTDPSQACTTGYYNYHTGGWDEALLEHQRLAPAIFPAITDTHGHLAETDPQVFGAAVPIGCIIGDQQSAAMAQNCRNPGEGKITLGTSATVNVNTGRDIVEIPGLYPLVLYRDEHETVYCLEGMVITAGALIDWLVNALGLFDSPADLEAAAATVPDAQGAAILPALQGLGSPYLDPGRHGTITGLTRGTTKPHIARAALEGIAFRLREVLDAVYATPALPRPPVIRVDGGAAANATLLQIQANVLGLPVEAMVPLEATAYGAAILAGLAAGLWGPAEIQSLRQATPAHVPEWTHDQREERYRAWRDAVHARANSSA